MTYAYDRLSRLTSAQDTAGSRAYGYDPAGNRTSAGATTYTYDRADRMTTAGGAAVTVDANGNLTAKGADTFGFDQANRLVSATVGGSSETYTYDGDGNRATRRIGGNPAIQYVTDPTGALPVTLTDGTRIFVYGLGLVYAVSGSSIEVVHPDRLGSVRSVTDATGAVTATHAYDEWGLLSGSTGSSSLPVGHTGEPYDATGLTYLRARYYNPSLGRFMTRDSKPGGVMTPATLHRYAYVVNNPITRTDPSGHDSKGFCLTGGLGVGPFGFTGTVCYVETETGQSGITGTVMGAGGWGLGGFLGVEGQVSTATDIIDLQGPFVAAVGSIDVGIGAQGSVWAGVGHCGDNNVTGASGGYSVGAGATAYGGGQLTGVWKLGGPEDQPCTAKSKVLR